ncbi:MAG: SDR family oxidoreductase [Chloroflexota bacterium]|nr:SDR family oxidoreductase [Chloroflexota bacterium]
MHIIITGGAGFIGSHLCDTLLAQGHEVTVVDNFLTGNRANIAHLEGQPNFRLIEQDITEPVGEDWLRGLGNVDAIFHLASPASPADFTTMPLAIAIINSQGTHNVLEWAKYLNARFLIASTSEAYGDPDPDMHPQREEYRGNVSTTGPRACYDEGKRFAEALTSIYANVYEGDARIVRIFNTYGPRMNPHDGRSVPNFITQSIRGEPLTLFGDGSQTRSYCYVSDMVNGLIAVMFAPPETRGMVFNVGNPDEREIRNLAEVIREACQSDSEIVYRPAPQDDPVRRCPDITRISTMLGWQPTVTLQEGLSKTIPWFRERLAQEAGEARVAS